jgi:four helix bundle protein
MSRDHRKLEAFQFADKLVVEIYRTSVHFPQEERYGLQSQVRRAAVFVPTNIVEGCARDSQAEYLRFLEIAFASTRELLYLIDLSNRLGFFKKEETESLTKQGNSVAGMLANLRDSISH